jgi:hypothetical protein
MIAEPTFMLETPGTLPLSDLGNAFELRRAVDNLRRVYPNSNTNSFPRK